MSEWVLERIGLKSPDVVFSKSYLTCGRMKDQDIVCLSLLVSRQHCEFTLLTDGLSVIDLGSSNGVFVNGKQIRARQRCMLQENDYVGIGCSNVESLDAHMFVYRVKRKTSQNVNQNRKRQPGARQPLTTIPAKMQKLSQDDGDIEIIECIDDDSDVIQERQVNPFGKPVAKECPKVASPVKSNDSNVHSKAQVGECSSTSNNDNEVESTAKNSAKMSEKDNLPSRKENLKNNVPNTSNKTENLKSNVQKVVPEVIDLSEPDPINIKLEPMQLDEVGTSDVNTTNPEVDSAQANNCPPANDDSAEVGTTNSAIVNQELASDAVENHLPSADDNDEFNAAEDESNFPNNIKQENVSACYSQIDLVELDDEDDFFPSSQLFNKSGIKEELEEADNNEQAHDSVYLDDEDENVITLVDSDDEINDPNYFDKLVQHIKPEPASSHEVIIPDVLDNYDNMAEDNLDPLANEVVSSSTRIEMDSTSSIPTGTKASDKGKKPANNEETDSSAQMESASTIDEQVPLSKEQSSSSLHDPLAPSTSKSFSSPKPKKKGVEIIEPHHMKPKKSRHSSDSNSSSSSRKDKKSKRHKSSSSSKKSSHHSSSSSRSKDKDKSSSRSHKSSENKEKKEDEKTNDSANQSASSSKKPEEPEKPKNRTTIVKAKVSSKSRGDMLCESMINLRPTPRTVAKKPDPAKTVPPKALERAFGVVHPSVIKTRREVPLSSRPVASPMNSPPSEVGDIDGLLEDLSDLNSAHTSTTSRLQSASTILQNTTNFMTPSSSAAGASPSDTESIANDLDLPSNSAPLKPSLTISLQNGNNKKVSFRENIASVKEFAIEPGNSMRNIREGPKSHKEVPKPLELKTEDFLARVFAWEPTWLEQQQKVKELPPIVDKAKLLPLPNTFNSFELYYKKMEVLLLLETWQLLLKEYECSGSKYKGSQVLCCAIERESIKQQLTPNRLRYSKLEIKTIVTKDELKNKSNPVYGDMIILEYTIKLNGQVKWRRAFAYVVEVRQQNSLRSLPSSHPLFKRVNNPHAIITYTVQTRVIDEHTVQFEQLARLRSILYLRPHLRLIKGLQYVPRSPLRDSILHVDIDEYKIDPDGAESISALVNSYDLVTKDKLNEKQTEAVVKFTDAATHMKSKIGLLVGPPGTGKSKVITNLVVQMLYGEGRFLSGNAKRILVCAPSNAAIDEIVLRLLEIRGAIKNREHRFRMVRIGREECMHEEVKKISVAELARKEADRLFIGNKQRLMEDVEHKKHLLMNTIHALNSLIASDPHSRAKYEIELEHKRAKYEKLAHRSPEADAVERNKLETNAKTTILTRAHVIACTLSSCYNGQMEAIFGGQTDHIATCIVDEATQCCEAETLIPLMLGVKNLFLVGDPNQLPATVMSTDAKKLGLDRSLFTRAKEALESQLDNIPEKSRDPVIMLKEQYRMVSAISFWPNKYFYKNRLIDRVAYKTSFPYHPYRILNVDGDQDETKFFNTGEAVFVGNLVNALMTCSKVHDIDKVTIGIITPYQSQRQVILTKIADQTRSVPLEIKKKFETECNTIDSFQGQERDVIIMSCVRSHGIGFLSDPQRLCVALTRAKHTLIICGNLTPFKRDKMWDDLLRDGRSRGLIVNLNKNASPNDIKQHVVRFEAMR